MKGCVIALCIFALLLVLIGCNCVFLRRTTGELETALRALSIEEQKALLELEALWQKQRRFIGLSVVSEELYTMDELLIQLRAAARAKNKEGFEVARDLALASVARICRLERICLDTLI